MRFRRCSSAWVVLVAGMVGCAGTKSVPVSVMMPGEITVKRGSTVAVTLFDGEGGYAVTERVQSKLFDGNHFTLVDRRHVEEREKEILRSIRGEVDPSAVQEFGRALSAGLLVCGVVDAYVVTNRRGADSPVQVLVSKSTGQEVSPVWALTHAKDVTMREVLRGTKVRDGRIAVTFKLLRVETGELAAQRTVDKIFHDSKVADANGTFDMPSDEFVLDLLVNQVADEFVGLVSPHRETVDLCWANLGGLKEKGKEAKGLFLAGLYARCRECLASCEGTAPDPKSAGALAYDIGLCFEAEGNLTQAKAAYERAVGGFNEVYVLASLRRIESRIAAERKLQEQRSS